MAQRVRTLLVDDLDGSEAHETVMFSLDRRNLEIDLSSANAERLRERLAQFIEKARVVGGKRQARRPVPPRAAPPKLPSTAQTAVAPVAFSAADKQRPVSAITRRTHPLAFSSEVRDWAREQGLPVADRGRLPNSVIEAYEVRSASKAKAKKRPAKTK